MRSSCLMLHPVPGTYEEPQKYKLLSFYLCLSSCYFLPEMLSLFHLRLGKTLGTSWSLKQRPSLVLTAEQFSGLVLACRSPPRRQQSGFPTGPWAPPGQGPCAFVSPRSYTFLVHDKCSSNI